MCWTILRQFREQVGNILKILRHNLKYFSHNYCWPQRKQDSWTCWLAGWKAGWLAGWLVGWLAGWLLAACWLPAGWLTTLLYNTMGQLPWKHVCIDAYFAWIPRSLGRQAGDLWARDGRWSDNTMICWLKLPRCHSVLFWYYNNAILFAPEHNLWKWP